jgi:DNA invertase Pin-like site-specific DNA recombinase
MAKQKNTKRAAIYARVSTSEQTTANQLRALRKVAKQAGWEVTTEFVDEGISGAKGRDKRPAFDALLKGSTRREFDIVLAWSVDRLGRSLQDLIGFLNEIHAAGVDLYLHQQGLDTSTPAGKAMFSMMGVFAEFEREIGRERTKEGLARARAQGKTLGRPKIPDAVIAEIKHAQANGESMRKAAMRLGVSVGSVHKVYQERKAS